MVIDTITYMCVCHPHARCTCGLLLYSRILVIDMSKSETFAETVEKATSLFGRVDMLVNNAGMCVGVLLVWVHCVGVLV